jgi:hypothetical protein
MSEATYRSPNFFEREIDSSAPSPSGPTGTPAGVIGTANKGPAFVPVSFGNFDEFVATFGNLDSKNYGPYAVNEFLKHRGALTYLRVLGAGAASTDGHVLTTLTTGRVRNAGFYVEGNAASDDSNGRHTGAVQFITARHTLQTSEAYGMPMFTDNDSYNGSIVNLIRGQIVMASGSRLMILDGDQSAVGAFTAAGPDDQATVVAGKFKIVISSSLGNAFWNTDGSSGIRIFTASLNPTSTDYFAKILNTDPDKFVQEQHYVLADYAVDDELATPTIIGVLSGSNNVSTVSGDSSLQMRKVFGAFDTRYKVPTTSFFVTQPFGTAEYDLFKFEALDDGEYANKLYKISIGNLKASLDDSNQYGSFSVYIRDWNDTDTNPNVLEQFSNCSLNPSADNYVAKVIGDRKLAFNFDVSILSDRKVVATGIYPNKSKLVRIIMSDNVVRSLVPAVSLPFGFRGAELIKTNDSLTDTSPASATSRLAGVLGVSVGSSMSGSILPPVPYRYKVTRGDILTTGMWPGDPGPTELASSLFHWGVKFERNTSPLNPNLSSEKNNIMSSYSKFGGIKLLDALVTGSGADTLNDNKFTLARVAFSNTALADVTGSINDHMREAAYIRNGRLDQSNYTITDAVLGKRITLATLLAQASAPDFNRFSPYTKFTNFMYGGYDGVNILDADARRLNDKSTSFDASGGAEASYVSPGLLINTAGTDQSNSTVLSYTTAIDIMTDPLIVNTNILAIPGICESFVTDYAMNAVREYGLALYVLDIPSYSDSSARLYVDSTSKPNVDKTASALDTRGVDNNYVSTYYPDVMIDDLTNKRKIRVPASVAAMGALSFNDRVAYPWFAPAGFNRASLDFVSNVIVRLNVSDRDVLQDSRINPIATFPRLGYVIYGQKTLQVNKSALDRVNVRRMLLEVKRIIIGIARNMVFQNSSSEERTKFVSAAILQLGFIQAQAGVESFQVVMNETNNTQLDVDLNRVNGRIVVVPTRVIEYISIDFIITNSGIIFT